MKVEKARLADAVQVQKVINHFAEKGEMLPRALGDIYESIRDLFVIRQGDRVAACAALHIYWEDLAEVRAVAVDEDCQKQGMGTQLVKACLAEAEVLGIDTVFCLTYKPSFFERFGFSVVDRMELPRKVWVECYHCPKFPNCDEVALIFKRGEGR